MSYILHLAKERFKFSCTHFTIFDATTAERMHGHNYRVFVDVEFEADVIENGLLVDFNIIKPHISELCDALDERILVPQNSKF